MILFNVLDGDIVTSRYKIDGSILPKKLLIEGNVINNGSKLLPAYPGPYEITPSNEEQILSTKDKRMNENVVINPIPSNYGLITWNGSYLRIS